MGNKVRERKKERKTSGYLAAVESETGKFFLGVRPCNK